MRKNRMMRLASALLILTMVTTCAISGTFAKYVTSDSGTDTARVAKWGVGITANGETFAEAYDEGVAIKTVASAEAGTDVVAPGTSGNMVSMTFVGDPEVAFKVEYTPVLTFSDNWKVDSNEYCPIIITVDGTDYKIDSSDVDMDEIAELKEAVENAIVSKGASYTVANSTTDIAVPSVSWKWPFDKDVTGASNVQTDANDTALGSQAAAGNAATISLTVTTTVTQVD